MKVKLKGLAPCLVAVAVLGCATACWGAPSRDFSTVYNGDPPSPIQQWFQLRDAPAVVSNQKEFYDNAAGESIPSYPWGGPKSWHAVGAVVTDVQVDPTGAITGFAVRAWVCNDLYDCDEYLWGADGQNDHAQVAWEVGRQVAEGMRDVRLTASFADDGIPGNLPDKPPFGPEANIYGIDHELLAWYSYYQGELPPSPVGDAGYWVPTWQFTGSSAVSCTGGTPDVILPGETHSRTMVFGLHRPISVGEPDYDTIMRSWQEGLELFLNRTRSLKVSNYPDTLSADPGAPFPEYPPVFDSDVSVFYDPEPTNAKWSQPPQPAHPGNLFYGWNEVSDWWHGPVIADDWVCTTPDPVTRIRWWGSFRNWTNLEPPALPNHFHIQFWTDVPAGPQNPFSHPGQVIHEVICSNYTWQFAGWDYDPRNRTYEACFVFDQTLQPSEFFFQEPAAGDPNIYWISISACDSGGPQTPHPWGWKTRPRDAASPAPDDAVRIVEPVQPTLGSQYMAGEPIYWPEPTDSWDMAFELTAQSVLHDIKWQQQPIPGQESHHYVGWDEPSAYRSAQIVADDWLCQDVRPVSDIHWWGSYLGWTEDIPPLDAPPVFHIGVWTDVPEGPLPFSHPGQMIHQWWVPRDQLNETFVGYDDYIGHSSDSCFRYDFRIPHREWFYQASGPVTSVYWLSISALYDSGLPQYPWGWKTRARDPMSPAPDAAVRIFDPTAPLPGDLYQAGEPIFDPLGTRMDVAFELTTPVYGEATVKWSQPPVPHSTDAFNGWDELSVYGSSQIVADDWVCLTNRPVTDIHWWGSYLGWSSEHAPPRLPDGFHFTIWKDVPIGPGGFSHPGTVIWQAYSSDYTWQFAGWDIDPRVDRVPEACYKFECQLPRESWFFQEPGTGIYWLSIAAVYLEGNPQEYPWGWKTRPRGDSLAPDDAVRVFDPTAPWVGMSYQSGEPIWWPDISSSWDMAFVLTTVPQPGSLTFDYNHAIPDHFWWPGQPSDSHNEMLSMWVSADPTEDVQWDTATLQAYGAGNDALDIAAVNVWIDENDDGRVDAGDLLIGSGVYPIDDGQVTISLGTPPPPPIAPIVIPAGGRISVLISYSMATPTSLPGSDYWLEVTGVTGTGVTSTLPVPIYGLPMWSNAKILAPEPVTIGWAKKQPVGTQVFLSEKVLTADLMTRMDLFYVEEQDRSSGIAITRMPALAESSVGDVGDRVSVLGQTVLLYGTDPMTDGTELAIVPERIVFSPGAPVAPLGMSNKWTGGSAFGSQPGVIDQASWMPPLVPAQGLNNVGSLVRTWGRVTCHNVDVMLPWGQSQVFWIDDGYNLHDGFLCQTGEQTAGVAVLMPASVLPPTGYWGITGIMKAIPNPMGSPVRLLVPRDDADMTPYPEPD